MTMPIEDQVTMIAALQAAQAAAERAYDNMYEARDARAVAWYAELAVDAYRDAMSTARELGLREEVDALAARLLHIKAVARQLR